MNIQSLIREAQTAGVRVYLRGGKVKLRGSNEAMEAVRPKLEPYRAELLAYLLNAERQAGEFWPWAPYLGATDMHRLRAELVDMIEELAGLECWPEAYSDDVLSRAIRGPLSDLMPNLHHFAGRLEAARAEAAARSALDQRTWHGEGCDDRRST